MKCWTEQAYRGTVSSLNKTVGIVLFAVYKLVHLESFRLPLKFLLTLLYKNRISLGNILEKIKTCFEKKVAVWVAFKFSVS